MPGKKPLFRQRRIILAGGVEHHLNNTFHVMAGWLQSPDVDAEPADQRTAQVVSGDPTATRLRWQASKELHDNRPIREPVQPVHDRSGSSLNQRMQGAARPLC